MIFDYVMKVAALITDAFTLWFFLFGRERGHFQQLTLLLLKFSVLSLSSREANTKENRWESSTRNKYTATLFTIQHNQKLTTRVNKN